MVILNFGKFDLRTLPTAFKVDLSDPDALMLSLSLGPTTALPPHPSCCCLLDLGVCLSAQILQLTGPVAEGCFYHHFREDKNDVQPWLSSWPALSLLVCGGRGLPIQASDSTAGFGHYCTVFKYFNM